MNTISFPLPHDRSIRLVQGDCFDLMAGLPDNQVSVIVTSPPYNLGITYSQYDDTIPRTQYLEWMDRWAEQTTRILNPEGSLFLNIGAAPRDPWIPFEVSRTVGQYLQLQNTIHWIKSISIDTPEISSSLFHDGPLSVGHYKPINSRRYLNDCHEFIFHFTHHGDVPIHRKAIGVPYSDKSNISRWNHAGSDLRCRGNNWFIPYDTITRRTKDRPHPATFPPRLAEMCARLHGIDTIQLLMDPFLGIGSTGLAAVQLNLNFVGCEIDPNYFAIASDRIQSALREIPPHS